MEQKDIKFQDASELKDHFLQMAAPMVKEYVDAALGIAPLSSKNATCREEVWSLLRELIIKSSDRLNLEVSGIKDILKLVEKGKCTVEQGQQLIDMYKKVVDSEKDIKGGMSEAFPTLNFYGVGCEPPKEAIKKKEDDNDLW